MHAIMKINSDNNIISECGPFVIIHIASATDKIKPPKLEKRKYNQENNDNISPLLNIPYPLVNII